MAFPNDFKNKSDSTFDALIDRPIDATYFNQLGDNVNNINNILESGDIARESTSQSILTEIGKLEDIIENSYKNIDGILEISTQINMLVQNLNLYSVDWVFKRSAKLGHVMNEAYNLKSELLASLDTWSQIKNNSEAVSLLLTSEFGITQILNSTILNPSEFLNIIVKNNVHRTLLGAQTFIHKLYKILEKLANNSTYFTATPRIQGGSPNIGQYVSNKTGTFVNGYTGAGNALAFVDEIQISASGYAISLYSLDNISKLIASYSYPNSALVEYVLTGGSYSVGRYFNVTVYIAK